MKTDPIININDEIEVEMSANLINGFRYDYDLMTRSWVDRGASNRFKIGTVESIYNFSVLVKFSSELEFAIPLKGNIYYCEGQFSMPGFAKVIRNKIKCECGAVKVYGNNTRHSFWCPLYTPNPWTNL